MATHSSVLAWRIPGTEEPDGLPSMGSHRVRHDWIDLAATAAENLFHMHEKLIYVLFSYNQFKSKNMHTKSPMYKTHKEENANFS